MGDKDIAEQLQETNENVETEGTQEPEDSTPEKMLPASYVNELVKKAKRKGEQKMQEQLDAATQQLNELKAQQEQQQAPQQQAAPAPAPQEQQGFDTEKLQMQVMQKLAEQQREAEEKKQAEQLEQEVNEVAKQYFGKMAQGKDIYDDFESMTADFNPAEFPQLVFLANQADNTAAVIYELRKNPGKLADLAVLVEKSPGMARSEITKLSESIKRNDEAKGSLLEAQNPLSRLKSSPTGTDNGTKTVRDYKSASYLRG